MRDSKWIIKIFSIIYTTIHEQKRNMQPLNDEDEVKVSIELRSIDIIPGT